MEEAENINAAVVGIILFIAVYVMYMIIYLCNLCLQCCGAFVSQVV